MAIKYKDYLTLFHFAILKHISTWLHVQYYKQKIMYSSLVINYIQILIVGTCNLSITYRIYFQMTKSMIFLYAMIRQTQNLLLEF